MRRLAAAALVLGALGVGSRSVVAAPPRNGAPEVGAARVAADLQDRLDSPSAGETIVVFVHGVHAGAARRAVQRAGLLELGELASIGVPVALGTAEQISALAEEPGVTYVEPNRAVRLLDEESSRAMRHTEARSLPYPGSPFTGKGQTIAIVDSGVDGTHPMFMKGGRSKVVRNLKVACLNYTPVYFPNGAGTGVQLPPDTCPKGTAAEPFILDMTSTNDTDTVSVGGHGTHVAGIAAGYPVTTSDGQSLMGVAPGAKLVAISTGVAIGIYGAAAGLDWIVRHHADPCGDSSCPPITAVNNSYGSPGEWDAESVTSKLHARLIAAGVVVVWANGNGDSLNGGGDGSENLSVADAQDPRPGVISVANYDDAGTGTRDGALASSSSRGQKGRPETWPDLSAPGSLITSACRPYLAICTTGDPDPNYGTTSGTSMASPAVAGAVAVLRQAVPGLSAEQVELTLQDSAHRFTFGGAYATDPQNPSTPSSFDKGHGLLDLANAINLATGRPMTEPAGAVPVCGTGSPIASDPKGDATRVGVVDLGDEAYDSGLDVLSVTAAGDPGKQLLIVTLRVLDLRPAAPGITGTSYGFVLDLGGESHLLVARRDASSVSFSAGDADVTGTFDAERDFVRWVIPRSTLTPTPVGIVVAKAVSDGHSRRTLPVPVAPESDAFSGACPVAVNVGGAPETPDGAAVVGAPYRWTGSTTTAVSDPTGLGVIGGVALSGRVTDERTVNVPAGGRLVLHVLADDPVVNDYDIELFGPDGKRIGFGSDDPTQADGSSAAAGGDETITVVHAPPGIYRVVVHAFATVESTYRGKVTIS